MRCSLRTAFSCLLFCLILTLHLVAQSPTATGGSPTIGGWNMNDPASAPTASSIFTALGSQAAGTFLGGPATGSGGPGFRALQQTDLPVSVGLQVSISGSSQSIGGNFTTVVLNTVTTDTASGWSPANNRYTVPVTGWYVCISSLRFNDNSTGGVNFSQGVGATLSDQPYMLWQTTQAVAGSGGTSRQGSINVRLAYLTAGSTVQLYAYVDGAGLGVNKAELDMFLLGH